MAWTSRRVPGRGSNDTCPRGPIQPIRIKKMRNVCRQHSYIKVPGMNPDVTLLRRNGTSISQVLWPTCAFDYSVAAALALNAEKLTVFQRHWNEKPDDPMPWSPSGLSSEQRKFLPKDPQFIASIRVKKFLDSGAWRDVKKELPGGADIDKMIDKGPEDAP